MKKLCPDLWVMFSRHDATNANLSAAGGAEERRDVQWSPGQLWQLDEHQPERSHLHFEGKAELYSLLKLKYLLV